MRPFWPPIGSEPRMAMFPDAYYLIMSLEDRAKPDLRAFRIVESAGRRGRGGDRMTTPAVHRGAGPALLAPHHPAGDRRRGAAQAARREGAVHRRRRARLAGRDVPRRRGRRDDRHRGLRRSTSPTCSARSCTATADVGRPKLDSAVEHLRAINPTIDVVAHDTADLDERVRDLRALRRHRRRHRQLPDALPRERRVALLGKPNVYGSIFRFEGQASVFCRAGDALLPVPVPEPPPPGLVPSCAEGGVLGVLPGVIGSIQATEAIKLIIGAGEPLDRPAAALRRARDALPRVKLRRDADCPVCGKHPTITELIDYEQFCGVPARSPPEEPNRWP